MSVRKCALEYYAQFLKTRINDSQYANDGGLTLSQKIQNHFAFMGNCIEIGIYAYVTATGKKYAPLHFSNVKFRF